MDADAILETGAGDVWLSPSLVTVASPEVALTTLRELHFAATGVQHRFTTAAGELDQSEAQLRFGTTTQAILSQLAVVGPQATAQLLESMTDFAFDQGGFDGIEGPALTAFLGTGGRLGGYPELMGMGFSRAYGEFGAPESPGGGYESGALLHPGTGALAFPDHGQQQELAASAAQGPAALAAQATHVLASGIAHASGTDSTAGRFASALEAGASGAATGASMGSVFPVIGTTFGAIAGGLIGFFDSLLSHSTPAETSQRQEAASNVATGHSVVVGNNTHITNSQVGGTHITTPIVVNNTGSGTVNANITVVCPTGETKSAETKSGPTTPEQRKIPESKEDRCEVESDGSLPPGHLPSFWGADGIDIGGASLIGEGLRGLHSSSRGSLGNTIQLMPTPTIDETGVLVDGGCSLGLLVEEIVAAARTRAGWKAHGPRDVAAAWNEVLRDHVTAPTNFEQPRPSRRELDLLVERGFLPDDRVIDVLIGTAGRHGGSR